jgi:hypothetical protein
MKKKVNEKRLGRIGKLFLAESSKKGKKRQGEFSRSKPPGFYHAHIPKDSNWNRPVSHTVLTTKTKSGTHQEPRRKHSWVGSSDEARRETIERRAVPFGHPRAKHSKPDPFGLEGESPRSSRSQVGKYTTADTKGRLALKKFKQSRGHTVEAPSDVADGGGNRFNRRRAQREKEKGRPLRTTSMKESFSHIAYILAEALGLGRDVGTREQRAFEVGRAMADREYRDPSTAAANKARREKLKRAGITNASAGMASRSKELRGEEPKRPKKAPKKVKRRSS